jgi:eukaryotic-like serine/threonine-protein kinase
MVWEAVDQDAKSYAIKLLRPELRTNQTEIANLKNSFEVGSKFTHPNIVKHIEYGTDPQLPYVVMEYFSEINLKQALRRGPDPIAHQLPSIGLRSFSWLCPLRCPAGKFAAGS